MNTQHTPDTAELKRLAMAATPGKWVYFPKPKYDEHHVSVPIEGSGFLRALFPDGCPTQRAEADARFIAAANPAAILALIDERYELQARCDELLALLEQVHLEAYGGELSSETWDKVDAAIAKARGNV